MNKTLSCAAVVAFLISILCLIVSFYQLLRRVNILGVIIPEFTSKFKVNIALNRVAAVAFRISVLCLSVSFYQLPRREKMLVVLYLNSHLSLSEQGFTPHSGGCIYNFHIVFVCFFLSIAPQGKIFGAGIPKFTSKFKVFLISNFIRRFSDP